MPKNLVRHDSSDTARYQHIGIIDRESLTLEYCTYAEGKQTARDRDIELYDGDEQYWTDITNPNTP
jgi:hypothetical protein